MVQHKQPKSNKKSALILQEKQQPKKAQLQFASSDEEDDSEEEELDVEGEDEFEDEDGLEDLEGEDELDVEDLEGEGSDDDGDDEEDDESEDDSGPLSKTPGKGLLKALQPPAKKNAAETPKALQQSTKKNAAETPKTLLQSTKKNAAETPKTLQQSTKTNATETPKTLLQSTKKNAAETPKTLQQSTKKNATETPKNAGKGDRAVMKPASEPASVGGKKRKATADDGKSPVTNGAPAAKLSRTSDIVNEEQRRRDERNKRTLFLKGVNKVVKKTSDIKSLHPDVVSVRTVGPNAWLVFPSEASCTKAHEQLKKAKVKGKSLLVDFCGKKSQHPGQESVFERPINLKKIVIQGIPTEITAEKLKIIFPAAKDVEIPKSVKDNRKGSAFAFISFGSEQEAQAAFRKGDSLKIGGVSVEVLYAREQKH